MGCSDASGKGSGIGREREKLNMSKKIYFASCMSCVSDAPDAQNVNRQSEPYIEPTSARRQPVVSQNLPEIRKKSFLYMFLI